MRRTLLFWEGRSLDFVPQVSAMHSVLLLTYGGRIVYRGSTFVSELNYCIVGREDFFCKGRMYHVEFF
jgi:hypothetical protein